MLARAENPGGEHPTKARFRFGASRAFFTRDEFEQYKQSVQRLALRAANVGTWTLTLIQTDPAFAQEVGQEIATRINGIQQRINGFFIDPISNEAVLEECLSMFEDFVRILDRLDRPGN